MRYETEFGIDDPIKLSLEFKRILTAISMTYDDIKF